MPVRPRLLHRMDLVSFRIFRKNLGNLREFFGQMVYRPPRQKIARTPMGARAEMTRQLGSCSVKIECLHPSCKCQLS